MMKKIVLDMQSDIHAHTMERITKSSLCRTRSVNLPC